MAYIECLLWSSCDDQDEPLDKNYDISDLAPETIEQIKKDCDAFIEKCGPLLDDLDDSQSGHDFWLTRNRHGVGFWDRGLGETGEQLTKIAHSFGERWAYVGDDGKIYVG
jgi:hypothetical protein